MVGQRTTRQRTAITSLLDDLDDFRSAQQVHVLLREKGQDIGLATVYRTLGAMASAGELDTLRTESGESLFRRCERPDRHHHHLVCRTCGRTVEVQGPNLETMVRAIGAEHGFVDIEHTLELFGTCANCATL
ncbi:Fur family transcriptional regulator [Cellulomonas citrea]|uniref:Fur family transcriptional regulator n=1 Tax=Cellulomonas citrea TaxID=1909423 RepID=UPI001358102A|nr:Fur family transcriptional regulator [Cellulomonas citrea]